MPSLPSFPHHQRPNPTQDLEVPTMNVRDVMSTDLITVDKDHNLRDVLALMRKHNITKLPVVNDGELVGVVTDGKIVDKLGRAHNKMIQVTTMHASSVMEKDFI